MRKRRLAGIAALALLIAPGQWWRAAPEADGGDDLRFVRLTAETPAGWPDSLTLEQAWGLDSANSAFAGFSALLIEGKRFRAISDFGSSAILPRPTAQVVVIVPTAFPRHREIANTPDTEAALIDSTSGTLWLSYEHHNKIRRISRSGVSRFVRPSAFTALGINSGVEAMARLEDGRFVMLTERGGRGFLFEGDPITAPPPAEFRFVLPDPYRATDIALLPDGRLLVLARALALGYPPVSSKLLLGDPAAIRAGGDWPLDELATIDEPGLRENYEGVAAEPAGDGTVIIWLISDDNRSAIQRTLLLKLRWQPDMQTAREANPTSR